MKRIQVGVDGLAVTVEGVLLVKRRFMPFGGFWGLPGGIVEDNEGLDDACRREFKEETGYNVIVKKIIDARIEEHPQETRVIITFHVTIDDGELSKSEEHTQIGFYKTSPGKMITDYYKIAQKINET